MSPERGVHLVAEERGYLRAAALDQRIIRFRELRSLADARRKELAARLRAISATYARRLSSPQERARRGDFRFQVATLEGHAALEHEARVARLLARLLKARAALGGS
jgi:hypothetical protein